MVLITFLEVWKHFQPSFREILNNISYHFTRIYLQIKTRLINISLDISMPAAIFSQNICIKTSLILD